MENSKLFHKGEANRKIRVLHFIHAFGFGGAHIKIMTLLKEIDNTKFSVDLALPASDAVDIRRFAMLQKKGVTIETFKLEGSSDIFGMLRLYRLIKRRNYHIVHIHQAKFGGTIGRLAARLALSPKIVVEEAGFAMNHYWINNPIYRFLHFRVVHPIWNTFFLDRMIAVSHAVAKSTVQREKVSPRRIRVICNGIDASQFNPSREASSEQRRVLGIPQDTFLVSFVGRFGPEKGISFLLKGFAQAFQRVNNIHLVLIGDGPLKEQLDREIANYNLAKNVTMVGWRDDIPSLLNAVDLLVLPSLNEAFGLVLLEAMAASVPVIGTQVGGIPEIIRHGRTGILVPPGSSEAIEASIIYACENQAAVDAMVKQAKHMVCDRFTSKGMAERVENLYFELVKGASRENNTWP